MDSEAIGSILAGNEGEIRRASERWRKQPVDQEIPPNGAPEPETCEATIGRPVSVTGPGTFFARSHSTITFIPSKTGGWRFDRMDLPDALPIEASAENVWTTARNIVLCSGSPHNYMRMVEHIVALKVGMGVDNLVLQLGSGDPPLFDRSSLDLVEAVETAGLVGGSRPARYFTVKEPVTVGGSNGSFLTFLPSENGSRMLYVDCAVNFRCAIGKQRIRFPVNAETFRHGASARTNTTLGKVIFCISVGLIFADVRNLGYTTRNILIAGRWRYLNRPRLLHDGKSLEAVWHRGTLDLLAAVALIDKGRFCGRIISYKAGHSLDVRMVRELYRHDLLVEV